MRLTANFAQSLPKIAVLMIDSRCVKALLLSLLVVSVVSLPTMACQGPQSESAQETDASVLFNGIPTSYSLRDGEIAGITSGAIAKITFSVVDTIRGPFQTQWTVLMRGRTLPKDLKDFQRRFGKVMTVGARDFGTSVGVNKFPEGYQFIYFVVDAACSMNGESWLLRHVRAR